MTAGWLYLAYRLGAGTGECWRGGGVGRGGGAWGAAGGDGTGGGGTVGGGESVEYIPFL